MVNISGIFDISEIEGYKESNLCYQGKLMVLSKVDYQTPRLLKISYK